MISPQNVTIPFPEIIVIAASSRNSVSEEHSLCLNWPSPPNVGPTHDQGTENLFHMISANGNNNNLKMQKNTNFLSQKSS